MSTGFEAVADALGQSHSGPFVTNCPGPLHGRGDQRPSLSVGKGSDGRALVYCHVGCSLEDIVDALGLTMGDLFTDYADRVVVAQYTYVDEESCPVFRVNRTADKEFFQERYENGEWKVGLGQARRVLYHLDEVLAAEQVYLVEGEKDVETLRTLGATATCFMGGAGKWNPEATEALRGKDVTIVADNDEPGKRHAFMVADALAGVALDVRIMLPARGKDVTDAVNAGADPFCIPFEGDLALAEFEPLDWETYEVMEREWLYKPYIPRGGRTLVFGKAASLKSLWAMWVAARVARDGGRVAYFSLEMLPSDAVARVKKFAPPKQNFMLMTNLKLGHPGHLELLVKAIKGYDLIVVDSWNAAYQFSSGRGTTDDQVAALDRDFFIPLVEGTGATLLLLDNTGHDAMTKDGPVAQEHARGSSAKGDKMDTTIWLDRPYKDNNYMTKVTVKKMRLDHPIPDPRIVVAPPDSDPIEFFYVDEHGQPVADAWTGEVPASGGTAALTAPPAPPEESLEGPGKLDLTAQLAIARLKDKFKEVSIA